MSQMVYVLGGISLLFIIGQAVVSRGDRARQRARKSVSFEDFDRDPRLRELPTEISRVVFDHLAEILGYPPLPTDRFADDFGLVGGDLEDLILACLKSLRIEVWHNDSIETEVESVLDLVSFLARYRAEAGVQD